MCDSFTWLELWPGSERVCITILENIHFCDEYLFLKFCNHMKHEMFHLYFRIDHCIIDLCKWNITSKTATNAPRLEFGICFIWHFINQFARSIFRLAYHGGYLHWRHHIHMPFDAEFAWITDLVSNIPNKSKRWDGIVTTMDLQIIEGICVRAHYFKHSNAPRALCVQT